MNETINVNLKPCACPDSSFHLGHAPYCTGRPILLPCPIQRSVELTVTLGECRCKRMAESPLMGYPDLSRAAMEAVAEGRHLSDCPARPIRVACSIGGETWGAAHVTDAEAPGVHGRTGELIQIADDRWALVKALVLGNHSPQEVGGKSLVPVEAWWALVTQRDAVFAALADMARHETAALQAQQRVDDAFPFYSYRDPTTDRRGSWPSHVRLAAFVNHLVHEIGRLP
jgi:hypothetical protein